MRRNQLLGLILTGLFVVCASLAWSSEADELRERAKAIEREAAELAEQGRSEAAAKLERKALELWKSAEKSGRKDRPTHGTDLDPHIEKLEAHVVDLRNLLERLRDEGAAKREQAEAKERLFVAQQELDQLRAERKAALTGAQRHAGSDFEKKHAAKIDAATQRIRHIWIAAEHLDQAGVHDLAGQLRSKAASMKQELGEQIRRVKEEAAHHGKQKHKAADAEIVELRQLVKRLQAEIKELRQRVEGQ